MLMKKTKRIILLGLISTILVLSVFGTFAAVPGVESESQYHPPIKGTTDEKYDEYYQLVSEYLSKYDYSIDGVEYVLDEFQMEIAYEHYTDNSQEPDYAVAYVECTTNGTRQYYEINGYYIYCLAPAFPFEEFQLTYFVIDTDTNKVSDLTEALERDFDKYFTFFTESGNVRITLIGDINRDKKLDVRDATTIQKCLAGLEDFYYDYKDEYLGFAEKMHGKWQRYVSDFNRDGVRNIKDATAIQKKIAGLPY